MGFLLIWWKIPTYPEKIFDRAMVIIFPSRQLKDTIAVEVFCFQVTQNVTSRRTKTSTVEYNIKFNHEKKTDSTDGYYLILLFIHLEEQTNSGKYKNMTQKYIKFISA